MSNNVNDVKGLNFYGIDSFDNVDEENRIGGKIRGIYFDDQLIHEFESKNSIETESDENSHLLYIYAKKSEYDGRLEFKVGHTDNSVKGRYDTDNDNGYLKCIYIKKIDKEDYINLCKEYGRKYNKNTPCDRLFHKEFKSLGGSWVKIKQGSHTEFYKYKKDLNSAEDVEYAISKFLRIVNKIYRHKAKAIPTKVYKRIYELSCDVAKSMVNKTKYVYLDLCPRWGKTRTVLELCKLYDNITTNNITDLKTKFSVMLSYVGTVHTSYDKEIQRNYDDIMYYHVDDLKTEEDINTAKEEIAEGFNNGKHCMIYIPLTGDIKLYNERKKVFDKLTKVNEDSKISVFIEEADFGTWCKKQINKIKKDFINNDNVFRVHVLSGTGVDKCTKFFEDCDGEDIEVFRKTYMKDILLNDNE